MPETAAASPDTASPEAYLQHPAVITLDWIGFFILLGSSAVLVYKLMTFRGPVNQQEYYFFGSVCRDAHRSLIYCLTECSWQIPRVEDALSVCKSFRCNSICEIVDVD